MASVSVDIVAPPQVVFLTRTNTELGAASVEIDAEGAVVFHGVCKMVTEGMLSSYPRSVLGEWTPNRAAIRFTADEIDQRKVRRLGADDSLDLEALKALAS